MHQANTLPLADKLTMLGRAIANAAIDTARAEVQRHATEFGAEMDRQLDRTLQKFGITTKRPPQTR